MRLFDRLNSFFSNLSKKSYVNGVWVKVGGLLGFNFGGGNWAGAYQGWVYACVDVIAQDVAAHFNPRLIKKNSKGEKEEIFNSDAIRVLKHVNDESSLFDLIVTTVSHLKLAGNAYWYLVPSMGKSKMPAEIWPLDPSIMKVCRDKKTKRIAGYAAFIGGNEVPLKKNEVIHFKTFNPRSNDYGMGVVQAAALAIETDMSAATYNKKFFENSALPSGILYTEQTLDSDQLELMDKRWIEKFGGEEKTHKTAILHGGLKFEKVSLSQSEMEFLEQRRFSRDEILAMFRVPKAVLGIVEDVNRASAEAVDYIFAKRNTKPTSDSITSRLKESYLPVFGVNSDEHDIEVDNPVPQNKEIELAEDQAGIQSGWLTINEARSKRGLKPVKGGERPYISFGLVPIGSDSGSDSSDQSTKSYDKKAATVKLKQKILEESIRVVDKLTKKGKKRVSSLFTKAKESITSKLDTKSATKGYEDLLPDKDEWVGIFFDPLSELLIEGLSEGGKNGMANVGSKDKFDIKNKRAVEWISDHGLELCKTIVTTLRGEIREILATATEDGWGAFKLKEELEQWFDDSTDWKAEMIARSELTNAYNVGSLESYRQSNVVPQKEWVTSGFDQCETCKGNEQQGPIPLDSKFESGDSQPGAHPNCRCCLVPSGV